MHQNALFWNEKKSKFLGRGCPLPLVERGHPLLTPLPLGASTAFLTNRTLQRPMDERPWCTPLHTSQHVQQSVRAIPQRRSIWTPVQVMLQRRLITPSSDTMTHGNDESRDCCYSNQSHALHWKPAKIRQKTRRRHKTLTAGSGGATTGRVRSNDLSGRSTALRIALLRWQCEQKIKMLPYLTALFDFDGETALAAALAPPLTAGHNITRPHCLIMNHYHRPWVSQPLILDNR